ncbi:MAG: VOC family protein [Halioglobus sp.]
MVTGIHHINFLVRDLEAGVARYKQLLGVTEVLYGDLAGREVRTARFKVGDVWWVLVQPMTTDSVAARHLEQHGEGFFLLSLGVASLDAAVAEVTAAGGEFTSTEPRQGLADWQVIDLNTEHFFGAQLQLCESSD